MSKQKTATAGSFVQELFQMGLYKRSQGRITRQVTCGVIWVCFAFATWRLYGQLAIMSLPGGLEFWIPGAVLALGIWLGVRVVNMPRFADFLIAVEAEMHKVSWPSKGELMRSAAVVIFVIFALAAVLFGFDLLWQFLFETIGVRR